MKMKAQLLVSYLLSLFIAMAFVAMVLSVFAGLLGRCCMIALPAV